MIDSIACEIDPFTHEIVIATKIALEGGVSRTTCVGTLLSTAAIVAQDESMSLALFLKAAEHVYLTSQQFRDKKEAPIDGP